MISTNIKKIIISRTDSIGDVILTLPLAGILKSVFPDCEIIFLGRTYTRDIINCCENVDEFFDYSEIEKLQSETQIKLLKNINADAIIHVFPNKEIVKLSKKAEIKFRIGTSHRWYNIIYCNKVVSFSRKKSKLHEAELNVKLLKPLGIDSSEFNIDNIISILNFSPKQLNNNIKLLFLNPDKINIVFHPKSKGSAREWSLDNYKKLIDILPEEKFHIILTGTEVEGQIFRNVLMNSNKKNIVDSSGKLSLDELISLISNVDFLLACSTGPLHIAGICNINAIGLYPPIEPMHPGRWSPLGKKVKIFCAEKHCSKCRKTFICECLNKINPEDVAKYILLESNIK